MENGMNRLLVVDDDPLIIKAVVRGLRSNYDVMTAHPGNHDLKSLVWCADIILTDWDMGDWKGGMFLEHAATKPVVVMSGGGNVDKAMETDARIRWLVRKPFEMEELRKVLSEALMAFHTTPNRIPPLKVV